MQEPNLKFLVIGFHGGIVKFVEEQTYKNVVTVYGNYDTPDKINQKLKENPNTIAVVVPGNFVFKYKNTLEEVNNVFKASNYLVKAVYSDIFVRGQGFSLKIFSSPLSVASPVFFINPGIDNFFENTSTQMIKKLNERYITYYYPDYLFTCHKQ